MGSEPGQEFERKVKRLCGTVDGELSELTWRTGNLSDWTLVCGQGAQRYEVHRIMLSIGPRSCRFFEAR